MNLNDLWKKTPLNNNDGHQLHQMLILQFILPMKLHQKSITSMRDFLDEVSQIEEVFPKLEGTKFDAMEIQDKWATIFKNKNLRYIKKLVSALLSISALNAFCESVFSVVGNVWDAERNQFKHDTVNSIVSIKVNAEFDCSQALKMFLSHSDLLKLAKSNQKYQNL
jgi:hypothetical protein